jgi:acetolactate synthase-1/2/3 large subunit
VAVSFRSQDLLDNRSPSYAGPLGNNADPALLARVQAADLVLAIGPRLDELTMAGYRLLEPPRPRQRLVHVHQGAEQLGSLYQADLAIAAGMPAFAAATRALPPVADPAWSDWSRAAREDYLAWSRPPPSRARLDPAAVVAWLSERLPADAVLTSGAGNYTGWVQRYYRFRQLGTQLAPKGGPWATACPPRSRLGLPTPGGWWWRSPATAASS